MTQRATLLIETRAKRMPYRLFGQIGDREIRFPLPSGETVLGSAAEADVVISDLTVSRRHAVVRIDGSRVEIEDLGSSNGTRIGDERLEATRDLEVGETVRLGSVALVLEEVEVDDVEPAVEFLAAAGALEETLEAAPGATTASLGSLRAFTLHTLPRLLERVARGEERAAICQAVGAALFEALPCTAFEIEQQSDSGTGVVFTAAHPATPTEPGTIERRYGDLTVRATFREARLASSYSPLIESAALLVGLSGVQSNSSRQGGEPRSVELPAEPVPPDPPSLDPVVQRIYREASRVAKGEVSILITGESGTGKELLARFIHRASARAAEPLVALNCAALPRDLLEAELFGIEKGVATGVEQRPGKFEQADGGTLFLDEIGDMELATQAKILRVLEEQEVFRLGATEPRPARVRVISATNRDLDGLLADRSLRRDLYHRIADWRVDLPPLRERRADIPNLAAHFLLRECERRGVRAAGISRAVMEILNRYAWPGNVRQLEREMARVALFLEDGELLESRHLQPAILREPEAAGGSGLKARLEAVERREIESAIAACGGDVPAAAESLGVARSTLYRRIKELGIQTGSV